MVRPYYNVAVDGPSGAGKSTICKAIAAKLDLTYIDTGAMYRAIAYGMIIANVDTFDEAAVVHHLPNCHIDYDAFPQVRLNGQVLGDLIRADNVSLAASTIARCQPVRDYCVTLQQGMATNGGCIMDGRDIGTVVLPDADVKIFLTADVNERARRRYLQNQEKKIDCTYAQVLEDVKKRDQQDTTRIHSPLIQASDAILVDTSTLDFDTTVDTLIHIIQTQTRKDGQHD